MSILRLSPVSETTDWLQVVVLWVAGVLAAMQFAKFSVGFEEIQQSYSASSTEISIALSIVGFVGLVLGVGAGVLASQIGYKRVLISALLVGALVGIFQSFIPPISSLTVSRFIEGFSHLGIVVAAPTLISQCTARRHQSLAMALWGTFFGVAFAVLGWIGPPMLNLYGLPTFLAAHGVSIGIVGLICIVVVKAIDEGTTSGGTSFAWFLRMNLAVYRTGRIVLPGALFLFHTLMFVALLTFLPRYAIHPGDQAWLLVALPLASIAGTFLSGFLAQYVLPPQTVVKIGYLILAGVGMLVFGMQSKDGNGFAMSATMMMFVSGIIQGGCFATIPVLARNAQEQAGANGAIAQLGNLGATLGTPFFALYLQKYGFISLPVIVLGLCTAGFAVGMLVRGASLEQRK